MLSFINIQSLEWISKWLPNALWLRDTLGEYIDSRRRQDLISQKVHLVVEHIFSIWLEDSRNDRHWRTIIDGREMSFFQFVEHHLVLHLQESDVTPREIQTLSLVQEVKSKIYDRVKRSEYIPTTQK